MCGIVGTFAFGPEAPRVDHDLLDRMRDTMIHRGPESGRTWVSKDERIGLAFRRLAIIDLSDSAMQPMSNVEESIWLVFNGEIYNHAQIRKELEIVANFRWKTDHSDTEVVLHAFEYWGIECLSRFRGMFAFAIWDARTSELWLVRDRIGIKPLYYSLRDGQISFASEIKALLKDPAQKREVNEDAFFHYMSFLTTPAPQTLFNGIKKLTGGTWLRINADGQVTENRYWDVLDFTQPLVGVSEEEIAAQLLAELRTAVQLRKVSDVPVGVFLSGGIDSSTNAVLFSENENKTVKTFTIGYSGNYQSYQNEFNYARQVANLVNSEHHEKSLSLDDLIDFLPQMVRLQDEPIADPVCIPVYFVSKMARENGVIVAQVGEGADELFCGYPQWKNLLLLQNALNMPFTEMVSRFALGGLIAIGKGCSMRGEYLRRASLAQPIFWGGAEAFSNRQKHTLLSTRLKKQYKDYTSWEVIRPIYERFEQKAWEKKPLNWMTYIDLNLRLPELLLMRVDKMSMGVSLEGRVPFLDHKFVELAMSIPQAVKTRNGVLKSILKKSVRGVIPDEVIDRPKQGFGVPIYEWFFGRLGDYIRQELIQFCENTDFLDPLEVQNMYIKQNGPHLWFLLNFALWWKEYIK
jgi:asparagine synthase (glutamine-hydrolysing)